MSVYIYIYIYTSVYIHIVYYIVIYIYIYIVIYIYIYLFIFLVIFLFIWTFINLFIYLFIIYLSYIYPYQYSRIRAAKAARIRDSGLRKSRVAPESASWKCQVTQNRYCGPKRRSKGCLLGNPESRKSKMIQNIQHIQNI